MTQVTSSGLDTSYSKLKIDKFELGSVGEAGEERSNSDLGAAGKRAEDGPARNNEHQAEEKKKR